MLYVAVGLHKLGQLNACDQDIIYIGWQLYWGKAIGETIFSPKNGTYMLVPAFRNTRPMPLPQFTCRRVMLFSRVEDVPSSVEYVLPRAL